jgi:hypothetical protein
MSCEAFSAVLAILANVVTCSAALLALAGISGDFRTQIDQQIRRLEDAGLGLQTPIKAAVDLWLRIIFKLFEWKLLSCKFFVFTLIYTLIISLLVMALWIVPEYAKYYSIHSFGDPAYMSPLMTEGIHQWFSFGIWIAIALNYPSVFLTKLGLRFLLRRKLGPLAFAVLSGSLTLFIYFVFSLVIFALRSYDMVSKAPYDPLPVIRYEFFPVSLEQWLQPVTFIYVTSQGWISTYFFPEPILFYGMVVTASMLPFLAISYAVVSLVRRAVHAVRLIFRSVFDPAVQAANFMVLMLAGMLTVGTFLMWWLNAITGKCLHAG